MCGDGARGRSTFHYETVDVTPQSPAADAAGQVFVVAVARLLRGRAVLMPSTPFGPTRWSWLACHDCLAVNTELESAWGFRPFALGRHSLMNGIGVRGGAPAEVQQEQIARLAKFAKGDDRLRDWGRQEYSRLASSFDPLGDIPIGVWQHEWAPSRSASWDAFSRLTGLKLP
jgi:hypothetical protein